MLSAFASCVVSGLWGGGVRSGSLLWTDFFRNLFLGYVSQSGRGFIVGPGPVAQGFSSPGPSRGGWVSLLWSSFSREDFSEVSSYPLSVLVHDWLSLRYSTWRVSDAVGGSLFRLLIESSGSGLSQGSVPGFQVCL